MTDDNESEMTHEATPEEQYELGDGLRRTLEIVTEDRNETHGDPYENHKQIAEMWSAFLTFKLDEPITAWEAAMMMQDVKRSRMQAGTLIGDHFDDAAGYAEVAKFAAVKDPDTEVDLDG